MKNVLALGLVCLLAGCASSGGDDSQGRGQAITGAGGAQPPPQPATGVTATPAATPAKPSAAISPILCTLTARGGSQHVDLVASADLSLSATLSAADDDGTTHTWGAFVGPPKDVGNSKAFQIDLEKDNLPVARSRASDLELGPNFPVQLLQFFNHSREDEVDVGCTANAE